MLVKRLWYALVFASLCGACAQSESLETSESMAATDRAGVSDTGCYKADNWICRMELAAVNRTNELRKSAGLPPLLHSKKYSYASRAWSQEQLRKNRISHEGFPEQRNRVYRSEFNESIKFGSENVAQNYIMRGQSPEEAGRKLAESWWDSPGHRENMKANYKYVGVGIVKQWDSSWNLDIFYATQLFGPSPY